MTPRALAIRTTQWSTRTWRGAHLPRRSCSACRSTRAAGRAWRQRTTASTSPQQAPLPGTWEAGVDDYKVVKDRLTTGFVRHEDAASGAAWLFDGTTFWTFDDPRIMAAKAEYARQNRLGGIMFWELSGDTPDGELIAAIADGP